MVKKKCIQCKEEKEFEKGEFEGYNKTCKECRMTNFNKYWEKYEGIAFGRQTLFDKLKDKVHDLLLKTKLLQKPIGSKDE